VYMIFYLAVRVISRLTAKIVYKEGRSSK